MKLKNWLLQLLGVFTTILSMAAIYLILFKDGKLQEISSNMLVEFAVVIVIAVSTKFFWYTSTENSIRTGEQYLAKREIVVTAIDTHITDAKNFDDFIAIENENNYNIYLSNKCKNMTVDNYKLSLADKLHKLFKHKPKKWYMIRYMLKIERDANAKHKLSGPNIRALTQTTDGLTDDRNMAASKKFTFLWTGAVFSFASMFITAAVAFEDKANIDMRYATLKMIIYFSQILFSILQAVLKARMIVVSEDIAYFNRILSIIEKYQTYKTNPYTVTKISYIPKEDKDEYGEKDNINTSD